MRHGLDTTRDRSEAVIVAFEGVVTSSDIIYTTGRHVISAVHDRVACARGIDPATRSKGWTHIQMPSVAELIVRGSLERCIRVLIHANTKRDVDEIRHVHLDGVAVPRPYHI